MITDTAGIRENIAVNVRFLREIRGLSVIEAAKQLGVGRQYWYLIEKGDANVTLDKLDSIAQILGVSVEDLVRVRKPKTKSTVPKNGPKDEPNKESA